MSLRLSLPVEETVWEEREKIYNSKLDEKFLVGKSLVNNYRCFIVIPSRGCKRGESGWSMKFFILCL